jgi:hypothetical protein
MENSESVTIKQSQVCPVHHSGPVVKAGNDLISIRCCCNFFTRKYISVINNRLNGKAISDILDDWETDLLLNELQLE